MHVFVIFSSCYLRCKQIFLLRGLVWKYLYFTFFSHRHPFLFAFHSSQKYLNNFNLIIRENFKQLKMTRSRALSQQLIYERKKMILLFRWVNIVWLDATFWGGTLFKKNLNYCFCWIEFLNFLKSFRFSVIFSSNK